MLYAERNHNYQSTVPSNWIITHTFTPAIFCLLSSNNSLEWKVNFSPRKQPRTESSTDNSKGGINNNWGEKQ